jgi:hypothetical protein
MPRRIGRVNLVLVVAVVVRKDAAGTNSEDSFEEYGVVLLAVFFSVCFSGCPLARCCFSCDGGDTD